MNLRTLLFVFFFVGLVISHSHHDDHDEVEESLQYVTYGSIIKLVHQDTGFRLHSHEVNYGSGSHQQSVTGFPKGDDINSFWIIKEAHDAAQVPQGTPIKSGDTFRLQHTTTQKNLHTHPHKAPLSEGFEVSCYGQGGFGDNADNWQLETIEKGAYWKRGEPVRIKHVIEGTYLASSTVTFPKPIAGQQEVKTVTKKKDALVLWKTEEGLYFEADLNKIKN